jgi:hypothetical protein
MGMDILRSKAVYIGLLLLFAFVPMIMFFDPVELYIFIGSILCTTSAAVVYAYWSALTATAGTRLQALQRVDVLTMALIIVFAAICLREGYVTISSEFFPTRGVTPRSEEFYIPLAFFRYLKVVAALLALGARRVLALEGVPFLGRLPGWPLAITSGALGSTIGLVLIYLH